MEPCPDLWHQHARQWARIGPPLRPCEADLRVMAARARDWQSANPDRAPRVLLLGVTPEIATLPWPPNTQLVALDHSLAMIRALWPGRRTGHSAACARWAAPPLPDASRDLVMGDTSLNALPGAHHYPPAISAIRHLLAPGGRYVMRFFVRPERPETPARVFSDLWEGGIGSFHVFKWRLAMALHGTLEDGVAVADVWRAWNAAVPEPAALAEARDWPAETIATIDAYRDSSTRLSFPTLAELRDLLAPDFTELACEISDYELGERCPILVCAPR